MGLKDTSKPVVSPGSTYLQMVLNGPALGASEAETFGSATMRLNFLGQTGRTFLSRVRRWHGQWLVVTERRLNQSSGRCDTSWAHGVWYGVYKRQPMVTKLTCFTDANWAGCLTTRRSTTCVALFHGDHLVKFSSQTQIPVAISVGESEFYALTKGAAQALGLQSICSDWGLSYAVDIHTDSSSSIGTASRRGAGKLRHIETPLLLDTADHREACGHTSQDTGNQKPGRSRHEDFGRTTDCSTLPTARIGDSSGHASAGAAYSSNDLS